MKLILVNAAVELHVHKQGQCVHQRPRPHYERGKPTAGQRDPGVSSTPSHCWSDLLCTGNQACASVRSYDSQHMWLRCSHTIFSQPILHSRSEGDPMPALFTSFSPIFHGWKAPECFALPSQQMQEYRSRLMMSAGALLGFRIVMLCCAVQMERIHIIPDHRRRIMGRDRRHMWRAWLIPVLRRRCGCA